MPTRFSSTARIRLTRLVSTPATVRRGLVRYDGATSACTSTSSGRDPSTVAVTADPATPPARSDSSISDGLDTSASPASCISNSPISSVEPKRFLTARSTR